MRKSKSKLPFELVRKGYDRIEVDSFLDKQKESYEKVLDEQKQLLDDLKSDNSRLSQEVKALTDRENEIKKVLVAATEKANDMSIDLKLQYALEIERLKIFQAKWTNAYEEIKERYHFDKDALNMESVVACTSLEIEKLLYKDFGIPLSQSGGEAEKQFKAEIERLEVGQEELSRLVASLKREMKEIS